MYQVCQLSKPKGNIHQLPEICRSCLNHLQPYINQAQLAWGFCENSSLVDW